MSAGIFSQTFYTANYRGLANIHPIRIQPETALATIGGTANTAPAGPSTVPISAMVTSSRRGLGLHARFLYLKILGAPPTTYAPGSKTRLVCLTPEFYNLGASIGTVVTYLGTTWTVTGFDAESAR